jgi:prevent-host-death family protein
VSLRESRWSAFEVRRSFGQALERVLGGERIVVERHGRTVAVLVPVEVYEQWQRSREEFFDRLRRATAVHEENEASPSGDTSPDP